MKHNYPTEEIMNQINAEEGGIFMLCDTEEVQSEDLKKKALEIGIFSKMQHGDLVKKISDLADRLGVTVSLKTFIMFEKKRNKEGEI